jgi:hypothetical protein
VRSRCHTSIVTGVVKRKNVYYFNISHRLRATSKKNKTQQWYNGSKVYS